MPDGDVPAEALAYAVCAVRDIANRRARGFHLLRLMPDGTAAPWHIVIVRWDRKLHAYVNLCPHQQVRLDWEADQFLDSTGARLICGKHGSIFDVETGLCVDGPCRGASLRRVALRVIDGDICVTGVTLVEDQAGTDSAA